MTLHTNFFKLQPKLNNRRAQRITGLNRSFDLSGGRTQIQRPSKYKSGRSSLNDSLGDLQPLNKSIELKSVPFDKIHEFMQSLVNKISGKYEQVKQENTVLTDHIAHLRNLIDKLEKKKQNEFIEHIETSGRKWIRIHKINDDTFYCNF